MSRQYELTVFAISSFNRENYNLEVSMNAFKESGGIDYSADVLLGLQARGAGRPGFQIDEEKRKDPRELELKILKTAPPPWASPFPSATIRPSPALWKADFGQNSRETHADFPRRNRRYPCQQKN